MAESDRALLDRATAASGESVSEFVRTAVRERAADVLRDETTIVIPADQAEAFLQRLETVDDDAVEALRELHRRARGVFSE